MISFSKKEALAYGWENIKKNFWPLVGMAIFVYFVSYAMSFLVQNMTNELAIVVWSFIITVVQWWLYLGYLYILFLVYDKKDFKFEDIFSKYDVLPSYIWATILYSLIIIAGIILLVIPGIIWAIKYHYYTYLIIDKKMSPVEAIKASGKITQGHKGNIFLFFILTALVNILGVLALGIGVLVTAPLSLLANVWVYRWLEQNSQAVEPVGEKDQLVAE